jgi:hypothetical protein
MAVGISSMGYQTKARYCAKCKRPTTHWREIDELPSAFAQRMDALIPHLWKLLFTRWNCRSCEGSPKGPLGN